VWQRVVEHLLEAFEGLLAVVQQVARQRPGVGAARRWPWRVREEFLPQPLQIAQLHLLDNDALDGFQKPFEGCRDGPPQQLGMIAHLQPDAAENLLCGADLGNALRAGDAQRAQEVLFEIFRRGLLVEQDREELELGFEFGAPTKNRRFLLDPVRLLDRSSREEDDRRVTLGQPFVEPPLPVVAGMQTLVVDQNLDLVGVLGLQRLAGVLQQLPVGLRLGVIRTGGAQSGTVADEKFESRHVGFSCGFRCVVGRALFLQEPTTHRASQAVVARFVGLRSSAQPTKASLRDEHEFLASLPVLRFADRFGDGNLELAGQGGGSGHIRTSALIDAEMARIAPITASLRSVL